MHPVTYSLATRHETLSLINAKSLLFLNEISDADNQWDQQLANPFDKKNEQKLEGFVNVFDKQDKFC